MDTTQNTQPPAPDPEHRIPPGDETAAQQAAQAQAATQQAPIYDATVGAQATHAQQAQAGQSVPVSAAHAKSAKKGGSNVKTFFISFAGALVACILCLGIFTAVNQNAQTYTVTETNSGITINANTDDMSLAEAVAAKTLPSVVNINVYANAQSQGFSLFGGQQSIAPDALQELQQTSLGSGVVLTADGYILTNNHVVEDAKKLEVVAEGETYEAKVIGTDASSDLAVIKVDAKLTPIEIGNSSELKVGEWVMAAGSPFGMEQSVSTGIVSALNRSYADTSTGAIYTGLIQTDAAINSGNSGGALVDGEGKLIGINTMIISPSGSSSGVGFAIPVDYAYSIAKQLMEGKTPSHAQMGVSLIDVNKQVASRFGLNVTEGAYVNSLVAGGAAAKAGLQEGDVIIKVDGEPITSSSDLILAVRSHAPGDTIKVTYIRAGKENTVDIPLGSDAN